MGVPSTSTYNPNRARIVQLALTDVGAIGPGTVAPSQDASPLVAHANDLLNILLKSMDRDGVLQWRSTLRTLTTIAGVAPYILPSDVYDLQQPARYTIAGQSSGSQVVSMSQDEWMSLGDRTLTGVPIQYFQYKNLDPTTGLEFITLYLYPGAANTGDTLEYQAQIKSRDQTGDADVMDVSQKWIRCLRFGLALDLAPGYGLPMDRIGFLQKMFETEREACLNDDNERGDVQFVAFNTYYGSGNGRQRGYR